MEEEEVANSLHGVTPSQPYLWEISLRLQQVERNWWDDPGSRPIPQVVNADPSPSPCHVASAAHRRCSGGAAPPRSQPCSRGLSVSPSRVTGLTSLWVPVPPNQRAGGSLLIIFRVLTLSWNGGQAGGWTASMLGLSPVQRLQSHHRTTAARDGRYLSHITRRGCHTSFTAY